MMLTLFARLYYVQLLDPHKPVQSAHLLHDGVIVVPAPRGLIVDARGRPLVANQTVTLPSYPYGSLAAHVLGYPSEITEADKKRNPQLTDSDSIGVSGLEQQYDAVLRGVDGKQVVELDPQGYTVRAGASTPA